MPYFDESCLIFIKPNLKLIKFKEKWMKHLERAQQPPDIELREQAIGLISSRKLQVTTILRKTSGKVGKYGELLFD
jgi:hypothetical protein